MKVAIDRGPGRDGGWHFSAGDMKSEPARSFPEACRRAIAAGHEIDNAGWKHKLLSWNFNCHAIDGYPEWEIERERSPAFARLSHVRSDGDVESSTLCNAWDDVATVGFYQRDWTDDGIPFVNKGDTYRSGWWFATIAERDRFLAWLKTQPVNASVEMP